MGGKITPEQMAEWVKSLKNKKVEHDPYASIKNKKVREWLRKRHEESGFKIEDLGEV